MYKEFYGLNRMPFQLLPDPDFFYRSRKHEKALTYLEFGFFDRAGFIVITGEIGTGKTTLLRYLLRSLNKDLPIALINQTYLPPDDFLRALCQEFSLPHELKGKSELLHLFGKFLVDQYQQGQYVILILDEAQNLPPDTLEEIRMLSNLDADNERLLQIILVGQPSLRNKLLHQNLRQLLQRVEVSYHLEALERDELQKYIRERLEAAGAEDPEIFDESAIEAIFDCSGGVPRVINSICHRCLLYGFADNEKKITPEIVAKTLKDRKAEGLYPPVQPEISTQNNEMNNASAMPKEDTEAFISQNQLKTALNRMTENSEVPMKAVEKDKAKAENITEQACLTAEEELADERTIRNTSENRITRTGEDITRPGNPPSESRYIKTDQVPANAEGRPIIETPVDSIEDDRFSFIGKSRQRTVLLLFLILAIFSFSFLAIWQPTSSNLQKPEPESQPEVLKQNMPPPDVKAGEISLNRTQPKTMIPAEENSAVQLPDTKTIPSIDSASQHDRNPVGNEKVESLPAAASKTMASQKQEESGEIKAEKYVCVVDLANVRAGPTIKAPVLWVIKQNTVVEVIAKEGNWMQLKNQGDKSAWIFSDLLRLQK